MSSKIPQRTLELGRVQGYYLSVRAPSRDPLELDLPGVRIVRDYSHFHFSNIKSFFGEFYVPVTPQLYESTGRLIWEFRPQSRESGHHWSDQEKDSDALEQVFGFLEKAGYEPRFIDLVGFVKGASERVTTD